MRLNTKRNPRVDANNRRKRVKLRDIEMKSQNITCHRNAMCTNDDINMFYY